MKQQEFISRPRLAQPRPRLAQPPGKNNQTHTGITPCAAQPRPAPGPA
ncbi:hypothetical protein A2U01_0091197 [Trifolium medium]|uniref:Uncharacterized protein n=1 Tax=Trifolium medium TaxID=97028 RepID=A0A392UB59_9FABA|nr:hypothetical protein [Trifolium medium]